MNAINDMILLTAGGHSMRSFILVPILFFFIGQLSASEFYLEDQDPQGLAELLKAQTEIQNNAPKGIDNFLLISIEELEEIRRIWIEEKHEIEDNLPRIYQQVTGKKYPAIEADDQSIFSLEDLQILKELCANPDDPDHMLYQMLREMLQIEQSYRGAYRRTGIFDLLEKSVRDHAFHNPKEALEFLMTNSEQSDQAVVERESEPQHDLFDEGSKAKVSS